MNVQVNLSPASVNGQTKWTLDVVVNGNGKSGGKSSYPDYPPVDVIKGHTNELMVYTIVGGGAWKFTNDPLWVSKGSQDPSSPSSVPDQINPQQIHVYKSGTELHFVDSNAGKSPITLRYTLNFNDGLGHHSSTLDPIINNGGCCSAHAADYLWYAVGAVAVIAIIVLAVRFLRTPTE